MNKNVFISYSWGNHEQQKWVEDLGKRLMSDTVKVKLDKWSLKEGHDVYNFMEEMVKSEEIFRVLIVCDKKYKSRADDRTGGVGTETQIITPNLYSDVRQEKFIPLLLERDTDDNPILPIYLANRKYIDFSVPEFFEESYEILLRNILEKPALPEPKLGETPPAYITEDKIEFIVVGSKIRTMSSNLAKTGKIGQREAVEFLTSFEEQLWSFNLENSPRELEGFGVRIFDTLKSYMPLRNLFISFVDMITSFENDYSSDLIIEFFEKAKIYNRPRENRSNWVETDYDSFKIIFHELYLYCIGISLKNANYKFIAELVGMRYYAQTPYHEKPLPRTFAFIYEYHNNLENYYTATYQKISGFGNYLISNLDKSIAKESLITADMICYVVSYLNHKNRIDRWFPMTYVYLDQRSMTFFEKLSSKKHFEKVKEIFDVENEIELTEKISLNKEESTQRLNYGSGNFTYVPFVYELISSSQLSAYK